MAFRGAAGAGLLAAGVALAFMARARMYGRSSELFIQKVASGNRFEIASSQLALQKSGDDNVKAFAQQMINHHTQIGADLRAVIDESRDRLAASAHLDMKHQHILDTLARETGHAFDRHYVKAQLAAHNDMASLLETYKNSGDHEAFRNFAARTLPAIRQHRERIAQIYAAYSGETGAH